MKRLKSIFRDFALERSHALYGDPSVDERDGVRAGSDVTAAGSAAAEPGSEPTLVRLVEGLRGRPFEHALLLGLVQRLEHRREPEVSLLLVDALRYGLFSPRQLESFAELARPPFPAPAVPLAFLSSGGAVPPWIEAYLGWSRSPATSDAANTRSGNRDAEPKPLDAWRDERQDVGGPGSGAESRRRPPDPVTRAESAGLLSDPATRAESFGLLGERATRAGLPTFGLFLFAAARRLDPANVRVGVALIDLLLDLGGGAMAKPLLAERHDVGDGPNAIWWAIEAARVQLLEGETSAARESLARYRALAEGSPARPYFEVARAAVKFARGLQVQALELIEAHRAVCDGWPFAARLRSLCYLMIFGQRDTSFAFRGFDAALASHRSDVNLWLEAARVGSQIPELRPLWLERLLQAIVGAPHFGLPYTLAPAVLEDAVVGKALHADVQERLARQRRTVERLLGR